MPANVRYIQRVGNGRPAVDIDLALEHCIQDPASFDGIRWNHPGRFYYEFPDGRWLEVLHPEQPRDQWQYAEINPIWILKSYLTNQPRKPITPIPDSLLKYSAYLDCETFCQWMVDQVEEPWIGLDRPPAPLRMDARESVRTSDDDTTAVTTPAVGTASKSKPRDENSADETIDPVMPTAKMFRVFYAVERGIRQKTIAEHFGMSQSTVHRYNEKVKAWVKSGGVLPGLEKVSAKKARPKTFSVDPKKMERFTESGERDIFEDE